MEDNEKHKIKGNIITDRDVQLSDILGQVKKIEDKALKR